MSDMFKCWSAALLCMAFCLSAIAEGAPPQRVEGFDQIEFHYDASNGRATRDYRGMAKGFTTAAWWAPGQWKQNEVIWKSAIVPEKEAATFVFVAASSPLPPELARGPEAKISVNGHYAVTFTLGYNRDITWADGDCRLKYTSKRVEFPFTGTHRQQELNGNSGLYELTVPASMIEAGKPATIKVEIPSFPAWERGWFMIKERRDVMTETVSSLQGEVETLRQDMVATNQSIQALANALYGEQQANHDFQHTVIYTNGHRHLHPADLIKLQNGELLMMTREATDHYARDGEVIMIRSKDGGLTWGEPQTIAAIKNFDEREGCGIQLSDGTIIVGVFYNNLYRDDGTYIFNDRQHLQEPQRRFLGSYIISSTDNGHTWSEPAYVDTTDMPFKNVEGPTDAPIEMPDGSILMGLIGYNFDGDEKNRAAVLIRSTDKGKSWKFHAVMAGDPKGLLGGFVEPGLVRTKSGRLIAGLRNHGQDHAIWMTYSDDEGLTWTPPQKTDLHGHPVDLIQLADGRVMATYGIRTPLHARPGGVRACFSNDNGATWDLSTEVQIRNDFLNWDVGYPESIQLEDGRILTVYYYNQSGKYFIGGTFWTP
ncbi:sialidase family protein [Planctomicrobium sp. SH664]|uniref:sialidase family protein n=1 Tax=Planctomicrobium sp. SH664 TaxID=3448125 RepID=UPI003F5C707C